MYQYVANVLIKMTLKDKFNDPIIMETSNGGSLHRSSETPSPKGSYLKTLTHPLAMFVEKNVTNTMDQWHLTTTENATHT